jgi:YD repeat-containing protein
VSGTAIVQDLSYGVDAAGNITGITDLLTGARSQVFQYDALHRLSCANGLYGQLSYGMTRWGTGYRSSAARRTWPRATPTPAATSTR